MHIHTYTHIYSIFFSFSLIIRSVCRIDTECISAKVYQPLTENVCNRTAHLTSASCLALNAYFMHPIICNISSTFIKRQECIAAIMHAKKWCVHRDEVFFLLLLLTVCSISIHVFHGNRHVIVYIQSFMMWPRSKCFRLGKIEMMCSLNVIWCRYIQCHILARIEHYLIIIMLFKWMPLTKKRYLYFSLISYSLAWLCIQCMFLKKTISEGAKEKSLIIPHCIVSLINGSCTKRYMCFFFFNHTNERAIESWITCCKKQFPKYLVLLKIKRGA